MNVRPYFRWLAAAAAFPGLSMATKLVTVRQFGNFGETIEDARRTEFFSWFHLVEAGREQRGFGEIVRFQPSGTKFHDLAVVSLETESGYIRAATLQLSRSFIDGPDQAFARDITSSFLRTSLPVEDLTNVNDLVQQIANDDRGGRPLVIHRDVDRTVPQPLTPAYLTFLGQRIEASQTLEHMDLRLFNTHSGGDHLLIRVDLTRPARRPSSCGRR